MSDYKLVKDMLGYFNSQLDDIEELISRKDMSHSGGLSFDELNAKLYCLKNAKKYLKQTLSYAEWKCNSPKAKTISKAEYHNLHFEYYWTDIDVFEKDINKLCTRPIKIIQSEYEGTIIVYEDNQDFIGYFYRFNEKYGLTFAQLLIELNIEKVE